MLRKDQNVKKKSTMQRKQNVKKKFKMYRKKTKNKEKTPNYKIISKHKVTINIEMFIPTLKKIYLSKN